MDKDLSKLIGLDAPKNVSDRLYQRISGLILSGELEEGYVFPNEPTLCEQLNVGRTSLREAYKALELAGYVTRSKRGTSVNSQQTILAATPLKTAFSNASARDFGEFRLMLEGESACLAARRAGLDDADALSALVDQMEGAYAAESFDELRELDSRFHREIARLSENSLIQATVTVATEALESSARQNFLSAAENNRAIFDRMIEQHREVVAAIRERNCERARTAMRSHIETVTAKG